jgi:hypothetical protein
MSRGGREERRRVKVESLAGNEEPKLLNIASLWYATVLKRKMWTWGQVLCEKGT